VSLVLPVKDDAALLRRCLEAVATLQPQPFETIVVDNGSSDDSAAVARAAGATVVAEPVPGILAAAARGFDTACGDVLVRFDADAVPGVDWLARIAAAFEADPDLAGLTGPGVFTELGPVARRIAAAYEGLYFRVVGRMLGRVPLFGSNLAIRATAWRDVSSQVHRTDAQVHDDLDLTIHLGPQRRLRFEPAVGIAVSARAVLSPSRLATAIRKTRHTIRTHPDAVRATRTGRLLAPLLGAGRLGALASSPEGSRPAR
jgi:cellulose synthase/poly-beta-1,6-N-acetylglucosamine synthase-like glycosyltransferase